jgi:hypothetical protein
VEWTEDDLDTIGGAEELEITSRRADGSLGAYTTIWVVQIGRSLFVRCGAGRSGRWFVSATESGEGRIRAAGIERDVTFEAPRNVSRQTIDEAYQKKYAKYAGSLLGLLLSAKAASAPLQLVGS